MAKQEQLRINAYVNNLSIYGRMPSNPEILVFGPPFEDNIPAGSRFPQLFLNTLTATDSALVKMLSKHQNVILERQDFCPICQISLEGGPHNQKAMEDHFQDHREL
jgi:hypothetical protein